MQMWVRQGFCLVASVLFVMASPMAHAAILTVGTNKTYAVPSAAFSAASDGDTIQIDPIVYTNDYVQTSRNNLKIYGVGVGRATLLSTVQPPNGKAIWVLDGTNTTIQNIAFTGAKLTSTNGGNGAGIRLESDTLTLISCAFSNNNDGILVNASLTSDIRIESSEFCFNGYTNVNDNPGGLYVGYAHNMYIGNVRSFMLSNSYSHASIGQGHLVKTRANANYILYNRITEESNGNASYEVQMAQGGLSFVIGNLIEKGANAANHTRVCCYGDENQNNPVQSLYFGNNTIVNDYVGTPSFIYFGASSASGQIVNNIFAGNGSVTPAGSVVYATNIVLSSTQETQLVNAASFNYQLKPGAFAIHAGATPGVYSNFDMTPVYQYIHPMTSAVRIVEGALDQGAYVYTNAPWIVTQPSNALVTAGYSATFSVGAIGNAPLGSQWKTNGVAIVGATNMSYVTPPATTNVTGEQFTVIITNQYGSITSAVATLSVTSSNLPPTIVSPALATPNPVTSTSAVLTVLGGDAAGETNLTYSWSTNGAAPAAAFFSINGNNAAKTTTVVFAEAGTYNLLVTVMDTFGLSITSGVAVLVDPAVAAITVVPSNAVVSYGNTQAYTASATDQFGFPMAATYAWSVSGGGSISTSGLFTAMTMGGVYTVQASSGGINGTASVTIPISSALWYTNSITPANSKIFTENWQNDGSIGNTLTVVLTNNAFAGALGSDFVAAGWVIPTNVPSGLTASMVKTATNTLIASLNGCAVNSANSNSITNLGFLFQNAAFTNGVASTVFGYNESDLSVAFLAQNASNWYVNGGTGSETNMGSTFVAPFLSITNAIVHAQSSANDVIHIAPGIYTQPMIALGGKVLTFSGGATNPWLTIIQPNPTPGTATNQSVFSVTGPAEFLNLTIQNGNVTGNGGGLGASASGNLVVSNCVFANNISSSVNYGGGAIYRGSGCGSAVVLNSMFSNNAAITSGGGAIYSYSSAFLLSGCLFTGNAASNGGVFCTYGCPVASTNCFFLANTATNGGVFATLGASGNYTFAFNGCTLASNTAACMGGALYVADNTVPIWNSTFVGNRAGINGGAIDYYSGNQGGIYATNSTFFANSASSTGGCFWVGIAGLSLNSSIVAGNTANLSSDLYCSVNAPFVTNSLIGTTNGMGALSACCAYAWPSTNSCGNYVGNGKTNAQSGLLPLAWNGGALPTCALVSNSAVINAGRNPLGLAYDERGTGYSRTNGLGQTDMGAYEYGSGSFGTTNYILTVTILGTGSTSLGTGSFVSVSISAGFSTQIVYAAGEWQRISILMSNGISVASAFGARVFTQIVMNAVGNMSNMATFAPATSAQAGYTNVPISWLTNWTEEGVAAANGHDGISIYNKYLLGLDPTASNTWRLTLDSLKVNGSNVIIAVRRDVTGAQATNGMNGSLMLQGACTLTNGFTNLPATAITGMSVFDGTGHRTYTNVMDAPRKHYQAVVQ